MKQYAPHHREIPRPFLSLLRSGSEFTGARIELRVAGGMTAFSQPPLPICIDCSGRNPETFRTCQNRRQEGGTAKLARSMRHWSCPHGCELFVLPVVVDDGPDWELIAICPPTGADRPTLPSGRETVRFLRNLADLLSEHLGLSLEFAETRNALNHRSEELDLLQTISGKLTEEEDLKRAIHEILAQARRALGADAAIISIRKRKIFEYVTHPVLEDGMAVPGRNWRRLGEKLSEHLSTGNRRYFSGSSDQIGFSTTTSGPAGQLLAVAVRAQDRIEGCLGLFYLGERNGSRSTEIRLLDSLAERISTVLANIELYENLRDFLMATVKSLVSAIDAKDPYTSGHSERVNILSMLLGKTMGLGADELETLRWASILHDVGKIGMPEAILKKPGLLTPEEFEIVKEHPDRGYRVLAPIRQLSGASMGVRGHHERVDGRGYPLGLHGDEIPLTARIIAVADTYDALTSTRSYRTRTTPDKAFGVIAQARGTQVDSGVAEVLEQLMPFIREHQVMIQMDQPDAQAA